MSIEISFEVAASNSCEGEVVRATTAAPTYFMPLRIGGQEYISGEFGFNNPSWQAWREVSIMHGNRDAVGLLLSIGAGEISKTRVPFFSHRGGGPIQRARYLWKDARNLLETDTRLIHEQMLNLTRGNDNYIRINPPVSIGNLRFDEWKESRKWSKGYSTQQTIERLMAEWLDQPDTIRMLQNAAQNLVHNRQERSTTRGWETFATGIEFKCYEEQCSSLRGDRTYITQHLRLVHGAEGRIVEEESAENSLVRVLRPTF